MHLSLRILALAVAAAVVVFLRCRDDLVSRSERVRFQNQGARLEGTLWLPAGDGPHPAAIFIHGSGPDTREGYRHYAEHLAGQGIAALVYDKRGTGASSGKWQHATFEDLARDALAGLACIRGHREIDPEGVGVIGISQGGWIAPLAATLSHHVRFVATISGSGVSPSAQVLHQWANRFREAGASRSQVQEGQQVIRQLWEYALGERDWKSVNQALTSARSQEWFRAAADKEGLWTNLPRPENLAWMTPWLRCKDFDPTSVWCRVSVPILLLFGEKDRSIPVRESMTILERALEEGANTDRRVHVFPKADHGIRVSGSLAPGFLDMLSSWILETTGEAR